MTDQNTSMMRDVFRLLSKYETVPVGDDTDYWRNLTTDAKAIYDKYTTALTRQILYGVIDGLQEMWKLGQLKQLRSGHIPVGTQLVMDNIN